MFGNPFVLVLIFLLSVLILAYLPLLWYIRHVDEKIESVRLALKYFQPVQIQQPPNFMLVQPVEDPDDWWKTGKKNPDLED